MAEMGTAAVMAAQMALTVYRQLFRGFCGGGVDRSCGQRVQDDGAHQISQVLAEFGQTDASLLREFIIFSHPAFKDPEAAVQEARVLQGVEEGIKAARTDLVSQSMQGLIQPVAIYRPLAGLVKDKDFHQPLEKIPMDGPCV